jgi:hypothetical protein
MPKAKTIRWVGFDGSLYEWTPSTTDVLEVDLGRANAGYGRLVVTPPGEAVERMRERQNEIRARLDEMVTAHPELKSWPR